MKFVFDNDRPIYIQLVEQLKIAIVSGQFSSGEKIPSVRDFASSAGVNPNTMQKALSDLESLKLVYTERTSGKFVTKDKKIIEKLKTELAKQKISSFLQDMEKLGFSKKEINQYLQK